MALADLEHGETEFAEGDVPLALEEAWQAAVTVAARSGVVVSVDMPSRKVGFFDGDFYGQSIQLTGYGARTRVRVSGAVLPGFSPFILREALDARPALTLEAIAREGMGARQWTLIFGT